MDVWNGNCHSRVAGLLLHVILEEIFFMETVILKNTLEGLKKGFLIKVKLLHKVIKKKKKKVCLGLCCCFSETF